MILLETKIDSNRSFKIQSIRGDDYPTFLCINDS